MKVLYPRVGCTTSNDVTKRAVSVRFSVMPFDEAIIRMLDDLSKRLFVEVRTDPALAPLAFFVRKASSTRMATNVRDRLPLGTVPTPQGLVFHVPPTNVDTLFLYTLSIALLSGNSNIVRISENSGPGTFRVLDILFEVLDNHPEIAALVTVVQFGRDMDTLTEFSQACDLRMIWGGDTSIQSVREARLSPAAKELTFPDRMSFAAIRGEAWQSADEEKKNQLAQGFFNDTFWFDQMACSSPQLLVIVSDSHAIHQAVEEDFVSRVTAIAERQYELPEGQAINKMVAAVNAVALGATHIEWESNFGVFVDGMNLQSASAVRPGGGFISTQEARSLKEVLPFIRRTTQTMSSFGFDTETMMEFALSLNGRGIDRLVPLGNALDFSSIWDGKDLPMEMLRLINVTASE
jgi:hypothetical protein